MRDAPSQIFSSGAYSSMSLRSVPSSAKRTVTTPPGSMRVTTPSPSDAVAHGVARRERRDVAPLAAARAAAHAAAASRSPTTTTAAAARARRRRAARRGSATARLYSRRPKSVRADRVREREALHGARHADVGEPPLLLDVVVLDRARVREDPLLHADHEDGAVLEALRVVERHQRHLRRVGRRSCPGRSTSEISCRKPRASAPRLRCAVLLRDADELLRGSRCGPAPRSCARPRAPRWCPLARAPPRAARRPSSSCAATSATPSSSRNARDRLERRGRRPRPPPGRRIASHSVIPSASACVTRRCERRVADPAPRPVGDAHEARPRRPGCRARCR